MEGLRRLEGRRPSPATARGMAAGGGGPAAEAAGLPRPVCPRPPLRGAPPVVLPPTRPPHSRFVPPPRGGSGPAAPGPQRPRPNANGRARQERARRGRRRRGLEAHAGVAAQPVAADELTGEVVGVEVQAHVEVAVVV